MRHTFLFVFVFTVSRVTGRASSPLDPPQDKNRENVFNIEDVLEEESVPIVKNVEVQNEENTVESNESERSARVLYTGNQLWKTFVDDRDKIEVLSRLKDDRDISTWGGNTTSIDILVKPENLDKVKAILTDKNINYDVLINDLQKAIDEENPSIFDDTEDRKGYRLTWQAYHRLKDIHEYLEYLSETYPDLCTLRNIGNSVLGKPIKLLKISNGNSSNKAIWIDGGIHAREWITPAVVTYIINHIILNFENEPHYMRNIDWYIAPLLNPDGYEYSHTVDRLWRKNRARSGQCSGTDLNRNFGYRWGGQGSSKNPCTETYGGTGPFSEPETAAVRKFITGTTAKWRAYVSFHSYGQYILYPWGYSKAVPPDYKDLEMVARQAAAAIRNVGGPSYTIGPAGNTLYPASGGSDDWAKGTMKMKYAYTIELRDNGRYGFVLPASFINPTAKEALAALRVIVKAAGVS
ncbi:hypothetical protein JTB14_032987 [Gonioctena quinquepunctata]|nr:hypothetical protein JTB14_032987 [Gonioctena quinquepunctata]